MIDYRDNFLFQQVPTRKDAQTLFGYLENYALAFFINKISLKNPLEWHRNQHVWGRYLLNKPDDGLEKEKFIFEAGEIKSAKLLRYTINELNRFMSYLHLRRPDEVPPLRFQPLSKAALKEHEARRKMSQRVHVSRYIKPEHWLKLCRFIEETQAPWRFAAYLSYFYGLRRNETMGLKLEDIRKSHLSVERQYNGKTVSGQPTYKPLKNREPRRVPHWFCGPRDLHRLVTGMTENVLHPDTVSEKFAAAMGQLSLPDYVFHDIRRTFITNAVKKKIEAEDLRLAVGHRHIQTTYRFYVMDARELEDGVWVPDDGDAA